MLISIIIPVYNVEDYIIQCLHSVAEQNYDGDIECIIVDDCGTDNSIRLVEKYISEYKGFVNFRLLHHDKNRGLSAARNTGIKASKGDWLFFLDSDDWITKDCISLLCNPINNDNTIQMSIGGFDTSDGSKAGGELLLQDGIYVDSILDKYLDKRIYVPVWNKLVNKNYILNNNLYFKEGLIHEDAHWSFCVACIISKIAVINVVTYHYLVRATSLDHIADTRIHQYHYAWVNALSADFIIKNKICNNSNLYKYIEKDRYNRFMAICWGGHVDIETKVYSLFRQNRYWSFFDIIFLKPTTGALLRSLHIYLPYNLGYKLFVKTYRKFGL